MKKERKIVHRNTRFGSYLTHLRIAQKLRQSDVADALGYTPAMISQLENGTRQPSLDKLQKFSQFFNVPAENFFQHLVS